MLSNFWNLITPKRRDQLVVCDLYTFVGVEDDCILESAKYKIEDETEGSFLTFLDLDEQPTKYQFDISEMFDFHQTHPNACKFQKRLKPKKGGDPESEVFGVTFDTEHEATKFVEKIWGRLKVNLPEPPIAMISGNLEELDKRSKSFQVRYRDCTAAVLQRENDCEAWLSIKHRDEIIFEDRLSPDLTITEFVPLSGFTFLGGAAFDPTPDASRFYCLSGLEEEQRKNFLASVQRALLERRRGAKLPSDASQADVVMTDAYPLGDSSTSRYDFESASEGEEEDFQDAEEEEEEEEEERYATPPRSRRVVNAFMENLQKGQKVYHTMEVGRENAFAFKGTPMKDDSSLEIFRAGGRGMKRATQIGAEKFSWDGRPLEISGTMLHEGERKMLLLDRTRRRPQDDDCAHVYSFDLETEKVVQAWDSNVALDGLVPRFKGAQRGPEKTALCHSAQSVFVMDPSTRSAINNTHKGSQFAYTTKVQLNTLATTEDKAFAVGNQMGEVRLFDGTTNYDGDFKKCKTKLDGIGSPLISLDVSADGKWVLGTTERALILYNTTPPSSDDAAAASSAKSAFFKSAAANAKPRPLRLTLPTDVQMEMGLTDICFRPARFTEDGESGKERGIVTSTGNVSLFWNFKQVAKVAERYAKGDICGIPRPKVALAADAVVDTRALPGAARGDSAVVVTPVAVRKPRFSTKLKPGKGSPN